MAASRAIVRIHNASRVSPAVLFLWVRTFMRMSVLLISALAASVSFAVHAQAPAAPANADADTRAWWAITGALSDDRMEGRDTGSAAYERAARYVADQFRAAGLKPAGDAGSYLQTVPLREVRVEKTGTDFRVLRRNGTAADLAFLQQISVRATEALPAKLDAPLVFRGYCSTKEVGADVAGKVVVCFGARRHGLPDGAARLAAVRKAGGLGLVAVDDPGFKIEPPRWPEAYARTVGFPDSDAPEASALPVMRLSADTFGVLIRGSGRSAKEILALGATSAPLPSFDIPATLQARFSLSRRRYTSPNVLGLLPGTDPTMEPQVVVVSAHLDGYGYGEPVQGDALYNGAFDDAAYVATLIRLAEQRHGRGFRRSVLFAAFTGEEKGLLGATWFTRHPTVPKANLAADINLDQLRPLFPLKLLTMHALDDTTLGATARTVAAGMNVDIRPDLEPDRHLLARADHWPFLKIGVPATGFVFGYDPGTEAERRYREWYRVRYHRPQDDMGQPIDFKAAADFNSFFYRLTQAVADAPQRPAFLPTSSLKPNYGS